MKGILHRFNLINNHSKGNAKFHYFRFITQCYNSLLKNGILDLYQIH